MNDSFGAAMCMEPVKAGGRTKYSNIRRYLCLLAISKYIEMGMHMIIVELVSIAFDSTYRSRLGRLVKQCPGNSGSYYGDYYRNNYYHVFLFSSPTCGKITIIPLL